MNYKKIYESIINRAKIREPDYTNAYYESHHVLPRCIGGTDSSSNLVKLTYKEHYLAHKLLVYIYPDNDALITALWMMTITTIAALKKYKNISYTNLSNIETFCLTHRINEFSVKPSDYEFARKKFIDSRIGHAVNKQVISDKTQEAMKDINIISKCASGSKNSKHYYNKNTLQSYKWFPGDPMIDETIYSWGRPHMSNEQKEKLRNLKNTGRQIYHNPDIQIYYFCYPSVINHMPSDWVIGKREYKNNAKTRILINSVYKKLIQYNIYDKSLLYAYPKEINKQRKTKPVITPGFFVQFKSNIISWINANDDKTKESIINDIVLYIIDNQEQYKTLLKEYLNV